MSDGPFNDHSGESPAPVGFELRESPETNWPRVIGLISIIYAAGGLLCSIGGVISSALTEWAVGLGGMDVTMPPAMKLMAIVSSMVTLLAAIVLLTGGIMLLRRRRTSAVILKTWVVLRLLLIAVGLAMIPISMSSQVEFQRDVAQERNRLYQEQGKETVAFDEQAVRRNAMIGGLVISGFQAIYPIFLGIWLSRRPIREEVAQWNGEGV